MLSYNVIVRSNKSYGKVIKTMKVKYAVALMKGEEETILGVFNTKAEADAFGNNNKLPHSMGLQYCFASRFSKGVPVGNSISVYNFYNV